MFTKVARKVTSKDFAKGVAITGGMVATCTIAAVVDHQQDVEFQKNNPGKPMKKNFFVINGMPITTREVEENDPSTTNRM